MRAFIEDVYGEDIKFLHERFDMCIVGFDETTMRVAYSIPKCIDIIIVSTHIEDEEEASEYFYTKIFNTVHHEHKDACTFVNHPDHGNYAWHYN